MMYRCESCGHLFEEGEQAVWEERHGLDAPPYEQWSGCPICKGGYEEVHQCKKCGDWHTQDDLYDGWCEKCLRETINYDTFFEYCEANKEHQYLDIFVMQEIFGMDCPNKVTNEWHECIVKTYKERTMLSDMIFSTPFGKMKDKLIDACIRFIMDDDGSIGRENYADWLNSKKEVK